MNAGDSARLELAKRAYRATEPSDLEVQTGVRRARLALRRPKQRRKWLSKGLVFVVLALGSLAYAKPHALGELVEHGFPGLSGRGSKPSVALASVTEEPKAPSAVAAPQVAPPPPPLSLVTTPSAPTESAPPHARPKRSVKAPPKAAAAPAPLPTPAPVTAPSEEVSVAEPRGDQAVSDWGRVGRALARGDEAGALAALGKLSGSEDARTRDKADLGRAQLLMAHGNREQACSLARALTRRRAGGHIDRQALLLLKDCSR